MLITKEEQKKFAALANALIDIPWISEDMEQPIFEHAIGLLEGVLKDALPDIFQELTRSAEKGIDPSQVPELTERLVAIANTKVDLPYLNEQQEAQLFHVVINPLVKSMAKGRSLSDVLPQIPSAG